MTLRLRCFASMANAGFRITERREVPMKNIRTLALTALSSGIIAIGSTMAMAQTANNSDNTTPGESGHGTGCSNGQTAGSGVGTGGDTNCMGNVSKTMNSNGTNTTGTDDQHRHELVHHDQPAGRQSRQLIDWRDRPRAGLLERPDGRQRPRHEQRRHRHQLPEHHRQSVMMDKRGPLQRCKGPFFRCGNLPQCRGVLVRRLPSRATQLCERSAP